MNTARKLQPEFQGHPFTRLMGEFAKWGDKIAKKKAAPHSEWKSEKKWFKALSAKYGPFDLDAAAADWNAQCPQYFTKRQNALKQRWFGRVWLNPPYNPAGTIGGFLAYARAQALFNGAVKLVGCLIPHYTAEGWWQENIDNPSGLGRLLDVRWFIDELGSCTVRRYERLEIHERRLNRRVRHMSKWGQQDSARYSSAFVVFKRPKP